MMVLLVIGSVVIIAINIVMAWRQIDDIKKGFEENDSKNNTPHPSGF